jgi:uncharacterized protein YqeY
MKQAKQRKESIADAEAADRGDLVAREQEELQIIHSYLPKLMTEEEIRTIATGVIEELGADGMGDMGRVMGRLMPQLKGNADGRVISDVVRNLLQS